jgi:hypothetical protein
MIFKGMLSCSIELLMRNGCQQHNSPTSYSPGILLLILSTRYHVPASLQYAFQVFVYCECDGLARSNTHDTGSYALVETANAFLFPHVTMQKSVNMLHIYTAPATYRPMPMILWIALVPGSAGDFCSLVLIVSIGAFVNGPTAPEMSPMSDVS